MTTTNTRAELTAKQIKAGWEHTFSTNNPFCPCDLKSFTKAVNWAERALAATATDTGAPLAGGFTAAEVCAERIQSVAAKYASVSEFGEALFLAPNWMMFVADLATEADAIASQPAQQADTADAAEPVAADLWYLQDTRQFVGNDVLWWAKDGRGYTTDLSKAHVFGAAEAERQVASRGVDRAGPKAYIDAKARPAVDFQHINHAEAIAAQALGARGEGA